MMKKFQLIGTTVSFFLGLAAANANTSHQLQNFLTDLENFKTKSLTLQSEQENFKAAQEHSYAKGLFWTPQLGLSAQGSKVWQNSIMDSKNTSPTNTQLAANLSLNLFRGGADINLKNSAKAQSKSQQWQLIGEALRLEISVSDLIFKSLYLAEMERIQKEFFKLKEESLKIVKARYQQGKLPLQEVTKTEIDLTSQKARVRSAQLDALENKSQISSMFIQTLQTSQWPCDEKTNMNIPSKNEEEKKENGETNIPFLAQKYWQLQMANENWKASKALHWPSLDFSLQHSWSHQSRDQFNVAGLEKQWSAQLALSFSLWDQGDTAAKVASSYAQTRSAENDYRAAEKSLEEKNIFLKSKIQTAKLNLEEANANLKTSRQLYQDILQSFRLGRITTNDLVLEQNRLLESENSLALGQLFFHQSLIEACASAGINSKQCFDF